MDVRLLQQLLEHRKAREQKLARERQLAVSQHQRAEAALTQLNHYATEYRHVGAAARKGQVQAGYLHDALEFGARLDETGRVQEAGLVEHRARAETATRHLLVAWQQREVLGRVLDGELRLQQRMRLSSEMNELEDQVSSRQGRLSGTDGAERSA
jgi:flagellar biosynthesis chaperone FliJ